MISVRRTRVFQKRKTETSAAGYVPVAFLQAAPMRRSRRTVLDSVDVQIEAREIVCLHGHNGSGKSTILEMLAGILPIEGEGRRLLPEHVGLCLQRGGSVLDLTVGERLTEALDAAGCRFSNEESLTWLERWGIQHRRDSRVAHLSAGQQRRVDVACALGAGFFGGAELIILDEPEAGLDATGRDELLRCLNDRLTGEAAVLIATHDSEVIGACDRTIDLTVPLEVETIPLEITPAGRRKAPSPLEHLRWFSRLERRTLQSTAHRFPMGLLTAAAAAMSLPTAAALNEQVWATTVGLLIIMPIIMVSVQKPTALIWLQEQRGFEWTRAVLGGRAIRDRILMTAALESLVWSLIFAIWMRLVIPDSFSSILTTTCLTWLVVIGTLAGMARASLDLLAARLPRPWASPTQLLLATLLGPLIVILSEASAWVDGTETTFPWPGAGLLVIFTVAALLFGENEG